VKLTDLAGTKVMTEMTPGRHAQQMMTCSTLQPVRIAIEITIPIAIATAAVALVMNSPVDVNEVIAQTMAEVLPDSVLTSPSKCLSGLSCV